MYLVYESNFQKIRNYYFRKILMDYASKNKTVLDYGCGPGDLLILAKTMKVKAYGLDLFKRSVYLAKQRGLKVAQGDYRNMQKLFPKIKFDLIFLQSVVEHMHDPIKELTVLTKYIKPGGRLIISSPTPSTYFWDDPTHVRPFTPKSFAILAEVLNLQIELVTYVLGYLLNIRITTRIIYLLLNIFPISLGSNLLGVYIKKHE